jgi:hypothetical protein
MPKALPPRPDLAWLRKAAKERLFELRKAAPATKLHQAQHAIAREYGFNSWRSLKAHVDALSLDGQIITAAAKGDVPALARRLAEHPAKVDITGGSWDRPLVHLAAESGHLTCVELLLRLGVDVNQRDTSDRASRRRNCRCAKARSCALCPPGSVGTLRFADPTFLRFAISSRGPLAQVAALRAF